MQAGRLAFWAALVSISSIILNGGLSAQQPEPPGEGNENGRPFELSPVKVIAPEVAPEAKRQNLPYPTTGITRDQFENLPNQRLGDVLQRLPGVTMGGAPGEKKDVRLRGMDKEFTRTQFDSVALTDGGEKREFQVWRFPSSLVGEVEIIRNPTAEYEADGIAGIVAVKTRDIPTEQLIEIETGFGNGTDLSVGEDRKFQATYGNRFADYGLQIGYSHLADPIFKNKSKRTIGGNSETEKEDKGATFNDAFADLAWFGGAHELHVKPLLLNLDEEKTKTKEKFKASGALDKTEIEDADELKRTTAVIVDHSYRGPAGVQVETKFTFSDTVEDKDKKKTFLKADGSLDKIEDEQEEKKDETFELGSKITLPFNLGVKNEIKFGGLARKRDRFKIKTKLETKGGVTADKSSPKDKYFFEEYVIAGFVQDTVHLTEKFSVTPGLRYEHVIQEPTSGASVTSRETISDLLPSLHAVYRPTDRAVLRASVSRQVNRPKFDELAPFRDEKSDEIVEGNPNLKPARSWSFDVGGDYATQDYFVGINFFHREVEGVIENVDTGINIGGKDLRRTENVGNGYIQGLELEQRVSLGYLAPKVLDNFSLRANQSFIRSELEDDTGRTRDFKEQPNFIGNISLVYEEPQSATTVSLSGNYVSEKSKDEFSGKREKTESEFFLDFYAETRLYKNVRIFGWVENITGEDRRKFKLDGAKTEIEDEDTGRAFFVGLKVRF